jgi:uncharacterized protein
LSATLISCTACGACCNRIGHPPFSLSGDEFAELEALRPDLAAGVQQAADAGRLERKLPCLWLDPTSKRCRHYDLRPKICRDFAIGSPKCLELRWLNGIE